MEDSPNFGRPRAIRGLAGNATTTTERGRRADEVCDVELIQAVRLGDLVAQETLVQRLSCVSSMVRLKHKRLGAPLRQDELDDVIQDVLLALWRKLARFDGRSRLEQWAFGFAVVEVMKAVERKIRRDTRISSTLRVEPTMEPRGLSACDVELLTITLAVLSQEHREIIELKHFENCTFDEIANRLGLVPNTVKTRYYRGIARMRSYLRESLNNAS